MTPDVREPAVAGRFYPSDPAQLGQVVERYLAPKPPEGVAARMLMVPHAGYVYSGAIAGETYAEARVPSSAIVLCPNHTGMGTRRSLWLHGSWHLPGFDLEIDAELAALVLQEAGLEEDRLAHLREHAIEVQLPFLHAMSPRISIVPICLGRLGFAECRSAGEGIARAIARTEERRKERVLLVASSDMSHYISADAARHLDGHALERVLALDAEGLHAVVNEEGISMCGYIPTTVALVAARALGATSAKLVRYGNSGEVSGDYDQVVGYAGVLVS